MTTTMMYGNSAMKTKREANSKVVQMILQKDEQDTQAVAAA